MTEELNFCLRNVEIEADPSDSIPGYFQRNLREICGDSSGSEEEGDINISTKDNHLPTRKSTCDQSSSNKIEIETEGGMNESAEECGLPTDVELHDQELDSDDEPIIWRKPKIPSPLTRRKSTRTCDQSSGNEIENEMEGGDDESMVDDYLPTGVELHDEESSSEDEPVQRRPQRKSTRTVQRKPQRKSTSKKSTQTRKKRTREESSPDEIETDIDSQRSPSSSVGISLRSGTRIKGKKRAMQDSDGIYMYPDESASVHIDEPEPSNENLRRSTDENGVRLDHIPQLSCSDILEKEVASLRWVCADNNKKIETLARTVSNLAKVVEEFTSRNSGPSTCGGRSSTTNSSVTHGSTPSGPASRAGIMPVSHNGLVVSQISTSSLLILNPHPPIPGIDQTPCQDTDWEKER